MKTRLLLVATLFLCALLLFSPVLSGYGNRPQGLQTRGDSSAGEDPEDPEKFICDNGDDEDELGDDEDPDCVGEITSMTLMYTGDGCPETSDELDGMVTCVGDAGGLEPVNILVGGRDFGTYRTYAEEDDIFVGDILKVRASMTGAVKE